MLLMGNLFGFRSTDPAALLIAHDPIGPGNFVQLDAMMIEAEVVVAAWGKCLAIERNTQASAMARHILKHQKTRCLGKNLDSSPKHPLYLKRTTELIKP